MTSYSIASLTQHFADLGLSLETTSTMGFRYRLSRHDGRGAAEYFSNASQVWRWWRATAAYLLQQANDVSRLANDAPHSPRARALIAAWLTRDETDPEFKKLLIANRPRTTGTLPRGWREALRPLMAVPPFNDLVLVPNTAAFIKHRFGNIDLKEPHKWCNVQPRQLEVEADEHGPDHVRRKSAAGTMGDERDGLA